MFFTVICPKQTVTTFRLELARYTSSLPSFSSHLLLLLPFLRAPLPTYSWNYVGLWCSSRHPERIRPIQVREQGSRLEGASTNELIACHEQPVCRGPKVAEEVLNNMVRGRRRRRCGVAAAPVAIAQVGERLQEPLWHPRGPSREPGLLRGCALASEGHATGETSAGPFRACGNRSVNAPMDASGHRA